MIGDRTAAKTGGREYFAALDGFRGLLAVFVAIYHTIWISHPQTWAFFNNGPVIIDLFFAFSGFVMWRIYANAMDTPDAVGHFLKRRFARLYPLHLFMLIIFVAYAVARLLAHKVGLAEVTPGEVLPFQSGGLEGWSAVLQHLTLTHALGLSEGLTFNPPSWTIGAEFCAYLVFAGVMLWCKPKRRLDYVLIGVGVAVIYILLSRAKPDMNITYDYGFWRCVAGFFTGLLAAVSFQWLAPRVRLWSKAAFTGLEVLVLLGSTAFVIYAGGKGQFWVGPVIFAFVICFAFDGGAVSRFMSHRVFRYLAKISYSVYLTHTIVAIGFAIVLERGLGQLPTEWAADAWLLIYLGVVLGVSHLTYHWVEVPGGRLIRRAKWPQKQVAKPGPSV